MLEYLIGIKADGKQAEEESNRVSKSFGGIERAASRLGLVIAGAFTVQALRKWLTDTVDAAKQLQMLGRTVGVSTDKIQEWKAGLSDSSVTIEDLAVNLKTLKIAITEAMGNRQSDVAFAFNRVGLVMKDLESLRPEQIFDRIAAAMQTLPATAQTTADLVRLLGRNAEMLVPAFKKGFAAAGQAARESGAIISQRDISALSEFGEAWERVYKRVKIASMEVAAFGVRQASKMGFGSQMASAVDKFATPGFANSEEQVWGVNKYNPLRLGSELAGIGRAAWSVAGHEQTITSAKDAATLSRSLRQRGVNISAEAVMGMGESDNPARQDQLDLLKRIADGIESVSAHTRELKQITKEAF